MSTISVSRALVELKMLTKRITAAIEVFRPVTIKVANILPDAKKSLAEFETDTKSDYQKLQAMIVRRNTIKSAIVMSNASRIVKVGVEDMTVAEAIERKASIISSKLLLSCLINLEARAAANINAHNKMAKAQLQQLVEKTLSKEASKIKDDEYEAISGPFMARNEATLVDPIKIEKKISRLRDEIDDFEQNVDIALTESNARTDIEV